MANPTGRYIHSEETLRKAQVYLDQLREGSVKPGAKLASFLTGEVLSTLDAKGLIALLMNTRRPRIFAESEPYLDGSDWTPRETSILGDIALSTSGTHAFNNGAHGVHQNYNDPLDVNFLFVASALLANGHGKRTADMSDVIQNELLNEEAYYQLYERRLLPGLLAQNELARKDGVKLVVNIPGMGLGQFAGVYKDQLQAALPRVLKRLFENHGSKLDKVHTVNYDPYAKLPEDRDEFTSNVGNIRLLARPLLGLPAGASGQVASQLEYPRDGADYSQCRLLKLVAWDHFSYPGNDIWVDSQNGNGRATDDGVSFASSDVLEALLSMGQFGTPSPINTFTYNPVNGIFYAKVPSQQNNVLGHSQLAYSYPSNVTVEMIDVVSVKPEAQELKIRSVFSKLERPSVDVRAMEPFTSPMLLHGTDHSSSPNEAVTKFPEASHINSSSEEEIKRFKDTLNRLNLLRPRMMAAGVRDLETLIKQVHRLKNKDKESVDDLTGILEDTYALLTGSDPMLPELYKMHAKTVQGRPSLEWQILGGVMMALGAAIVALGLVCLGMGMVPAAIPLIASGTISAAVGIGFFSTGLRTGLSKAMYDMPRVKLSPEHENVDVQHDDRREAPAPAMLR